MCPFMSFSLRESCTYKKSIIILYTVIICCCVCIHMYFLLLQHLFSSKCACIVFTEDHKLLCCKSHWTADESGKKYCTVGIKVFFTGSLFSYLE